MLNKLAAGMVMGIVVAILCAIIFAFGSGGGTAGSQRGVWAAAIGFAVMAVLALTAKRGRHAWGRGFLICGLLCFALPVASVIFSGVVAVDHVSGARSDAAKAGAAVGSALAGTAMTIVSSVVGLFLGLVFLASAYFSLRSLPS
ncbi:MAG: hypothetical protein KIS73_28760 [Enhydrobacter sp.]|nr:hypothetical protein [Enhydrobacter sp.]